VGSASLSYKGHRYPAEAISHCVWLYFRFPLSFREVEELMLERGIVVSYETIRRWCAKFGQTYANALRRRQPRPGYKWHLDEVFIKINGRLQHLWRAVDQDGNVLDILVQDRQDKAAARRFFRQLMKRPARCREWSSPTSSAPTALPAARSCPASSTASRSTSTTGRRTATIPPGSANGR
jgi:putative transposase